MDLFKFAAGQNFPSGSLFLVPTPIGNLADMTIRGLYILNQVDVIACEDKRHSANFLKAYGISKPLYALHEHNEKAASAHILEKLSQGERWAYISDAGTPGISDPGAILVETIKQAGFNVFPLPGPSAVVTAISGSGDFLKYGDGGFQFLGFLPTKANQRDAVIQRAQQAGVSSFFYEAPHRIESSLKAIAQLLEKDRKILIAKELTKVFEEIHVISIADLPGWMGSVKNWQGEFVIGIEGQPPTKSRSAFDENTKNWIHAIGDKVGHKELSEIVSAVTGISKKDAYKELMEIKKK